MHLSLKEKHTWYPADPRNIGWRQFNIPPLSKDEQWGPRDLLPRAQMPVMCPPCREKSRERGPRGRSKIPQQKHHAMRTSPERETDTKTGSATPTVPSPCQGFNSPKRILSRALWCFQRQPMMNTDTPRGRISTDAFPCREKCAASKCPLRPAIRARVAGENSYQRAHH